MARRPKGLLPRPTHGTNDSILSVLLGDRTRTLVTTTVITALQTLGCGRKSKIPIPNRVFLNNQILGRNIWWNVWRSYHDDVFVFVLSVAVVSVFIEFYFHLCDVFEVAFFEERIPGWGGLEIGLQALSVCEIGAPFHQLGASASSLMGGVGVEDVEHCL